MKSDPQRGDIASLGSDLLWEGLGRGVKAEPTPCWDSVAFTNATVSWASLASLVVPLNIRHSPISSENL